MYGREFRLPMSALATVARKSFNGKLTARNDFPIRAFYVSIADADIGSLKSVHTLFDEYLDHMLVKFENLVLFDKKWFNNFWQSVDAILEDVSATEAIVCTKLLI